MDDNGNPLRMVSDASDFQPRMTTETATAVNYPMGGRMDVRNRFMETDDFSADFALRSTAMGPQASYQTPQVAQAPVIQVHPPHPYDPPNTAAGSFHVQSLGAYRHHRTDTIAVPPSNIQSSGLYRQPINAVAGPSSSNLHGPQPTDAGPSSSNLRSPLPTATMEQAQWFGYAPPQRSGHFIHPSDVEYERHLQWIKNHRA